MAGTAVVAVGCGGQQPVDVPVVARSVRALMDSGWNTVLVPPPAPSGADLAGPLTLAMGQSRSGRRAVPVVTHILVDPADPALAHPPATAQAEPLAVLDGLASRTPPGGVDDRGRFDGAAGTRLLRIRRTLARSRSEAPVLTAGWC